MSDTEEEDMPDPGLGPGASFTEGLELEAPTGYENLQTRSALASPPRSQQANGGQETSKLRKAVARLSGRTEDLEASRDEFRELYEEAVDELKTLAKVMEVFLTAASLQAAEKGPSAQSLDSWLLSEIKELSPMVDHANEFVSKALQGSGSAGRMMNKPGEKHTVGLGQPTASSPSKEDAGDLYDVSSSEDNGTMLL